MADPIGNKNEDEAVKVKIIGALKIKSMEMYEG